MSSSRKDPHKRKLRSKAVRAKVLARREEIRAERKAIAEELQKDRTMHELEHGKVPQLAPGHPELADKVLAEREAKRMERIKRNLEVLRQLEDEYDREQAARSNINGQLESEGFSTFKEKIDAMQEKLRKYAEENGDHSDVDGLPEPPGEDNSVVQ